MARLQVCCYGRCRSAVPARHPTARELLATDDLDAAAANVHLAPIGAGEKVRTEALPWVGGRRTCWHGCPMWHTSMGMLTADEHHAFCSLGGVGGASR